MPILFSMTDKVKLIEEVLDLKPKDKSGKNPPERSEVIISDRLISWLIIHVIELVEKDDQKALLTIITKYLIERKHLDSDLSILLNAFNAL
jgi:hypothetical protein